MALGVACNMLGSVLAKPLTDRFDKLALFRIINIILGILSFALWFVDPQSLTPLMTLFIIINVLHLIQSGPILWAMMSDVDDYGDWKFGKRLTGISFAGNLFMLKMGLAVAGAIVAWILAFTGYVANEPQQNSQTIQGIIMMFSLLPMVSYFISAYLVRYFKLNNAFLEKSKRILQNVSWKKVAVNHRRQDIRFIQQSHSYGLLVIDFNLISKEVFMAHKNYYDVTQWHIGNPYEDIGEVINSIIADIKSTNRNRC
jgi:Na+/melibiose symporter-like transporter